MYQFYNETVSGDFRIACRVVTSWHHPLVIFLGSTGASTEGMDAVDCSVLHEEHGKHQAARAEIHDQDAGKELPEKVASMPHGSHNRPKNFDDLMLRQAVITRPDIFPSIYCQYLSKVHVYLLIQVFYELVCGNLVTIVFVEIIMRASLIHSSIEQLFIGICF